MNLLEPEGTEGRLFRFAVEMSHKLDMNLIRPPQQLHTLDAVGADCHSLSCLTDTGVLVFVLPPPPSTPPTPRPPVGQGDAQ